MGANLTQQNKTLRNTLNDRDEKIAKLEAENKAAQEKLEAAEKAKAESATKEVVPSGPEVESTSLQTEAVTPETDGESDEGDSLQSLVAMQEADAQKLRRSSSAENRPRRKPISTRDILPPRQRPGYRRRYVLNVEGRVPMLMEHGYKIVVGKERADGSKTSGVGSAITEPAGGGKRHVLMEIKEEWYNEDQAEKQRLIAENEGGMFAEANKAEGQYGSVTQKTRL